MSSGIDGSHMRWRICLAASGEVMPMLQFGAFLPLSLKQANTLNFQPFLWNVKTYQLRVKTSVDPWKQKFSAWLLTLVGYTHELFDELHSPSPKWAFILRLKLRKKGTLAKVNDPTYFTVTSEICYSNTCWLLRPEPSPIEDIGRCRGWKAAIRVNASVVRRQSA